MAFRILAVLVVETEFIFAMQLYAFSAKYYGTVPATQGEYHVANVTLSRCTLICTAANCTSLFFNPDLLECRLYNNRPYDLKLHRSEGWSTYHLQGEIRSWAIEVIGVSSQYGETEWTPERALGKPDLYPQYKDADFAWAALKESSPHEWIALGFQEKVYVREIHVYETYHAGAVNDVSGRRHDGSWQSLWSTRHVQDIEQSRIFKPILKKPYFRTSVIRISIDGSKSESWPEIDAVQITGDFQAY